MRYPAERSELSRVQGGFTSIVDRPGRALPDHDDHGYGPLAVVVESILEPGTHIPMHQHRNDEIVSYVPEGLMRHDDRTVGELVTDSEHLMVMNAGSGFFHAERTLADDPHLRMLQIFVRPREPDLEPNIQHGPVPDPEQNDWRWLLGPEGSDAPFFVRNDVELHDVRLDEGATVELPEREGWDAYCYVFSGTVELDEVRLGEAETCLLVDETGVDVTAREPTLLVCFLVNPDAPAPGVGSVGR